MLFWAAIAVALLIFSAIYFYFYAPPSFPIRTADAAEILAAEPHQLLFFRFRPDPRVIVLDFPDPLAQGQMLNRITAFLEKAGVPRERVLADDELAASIRAAGATPATYAPTHAYSAASLVRFFRLMAEDRVAPNREESELRALIGALHWFAPGAVGALVALPGAGAPSARARLLSHELANAAYFVSPAYAVHAQRFFQDTLTPSERDFFRHLLAARGDDPDLTDLLVNETQATLLFPLARILIAPARLQELRTRYRQGIPLGWLKEIAPDPAASRR